MKKIIFPLVMLACTAMVISSCSPSRLFMISGSGIATYNRHTGQFEILWEHKEEPVKIAHDTVYVDSCKIGK